MTERITERHLQGKIDTINRLLGIDPDAGYNAKGLVHLGGAYGGTTVYRYVGESGAVSNVMYGFHTKREVAMFLDGMIQALYLTNES